MLEDYPEAKAMMAERGRMTLKHDRDADESLTSEDAVNNICTHYIIQV